MTYIYEPIGQLGPFCVDFAVSSGCSITSHIHIRLTGYSKSAKGINVSVSGCLSLSVNPVTDW